MKNFIIVLSLISCVFAVSFAAPKKSSRDKRTINLFVNSFLDAFTNTLNQRTATQAEAAAARAVQAAQAARATANASQRPANNVQGNAFGIGFGATLPRLGLFPLIIPSIPNPASSAPIAPPAQIPPPNNGPARVNIPLAMPALATSSSPAPTTLPPPPPPADTTLPPSQPTSVPTDVLPTTIPAGSDFGQLPTTTGDDDSKDYDSSSTEVEDDDDNDDNLISSKSDLNPQLNENSSTSDHDKFDSKFWRTSPPAWYKNDNIYSEFSNTPRSTYYSKQLERIKSFQPNRKNYNQPISHVRPTTFYSQQPETSFSGTNGYYNDHIQSAATMFPTSSHSRVKMHDHGYDHFTFHDNHEQTQPNAYRSEYYGKRKWD